MLPSEEEEKHVQPCQMFSTTSQLQWKYPYQVATY